MGGARRYDNSVFINCPFDEAYRPIFDALVFTVFDCGFVARSSLEFAGSGGVRIENIVSLIRECKCGIHDISCTELSADSELPRFNMPFELGIFVGAMKLGMGKQKQKDCVILDREKYRYQRFISDIAGQDVKAHSDDYRIAIRRVRDWLKAASQPGDTIPGGTKMAERYDEFVSALPTLCERVHLTPEEVTFNELATLVPGWLIEKSW
jgi:hypothetical protein